VALAQLALDALENAQCQNPAQAAPIEREDPFGSTCSEVLFEPAFRIGQRRSSRP
jgi:hypothetical protein